MALPIRLIAIHAALGNQGRKYTFLIVNSPTRLQHLLPFENDQL